MILFPHAKINLTLFITGRMENGYHAIDTVFWPVPLYDKLIIEKSESFSFSCSDKKLEGDDNLVCRAFSLMRERFGLPQVRIFLEKNIPYQAGLGGGSADAAAVINACVELFSLSLSDHEKAQAGELLGADVPAGLSFFPQRGEETGARVRRIAPYWPLPLLIIKPREGFSTAAMYRRWDEKQGGSARNTREISRRQEALEEALIRQDAAAVCGLLHNDFEELLEPQEEMILQKAKRLFEESGAAGSLLCGSGSAVFGIYLNEADRNEAAALLEGKMPRGWQLLLPKERELNAETDV